MLVPLLRAEGEKQPHPSCQFSPKLWWLSRSCMLACLSPHHLSAWLLLSVETQLVSLQSALHTSVGLTIHPWKFPSIALLQRTPSDPTPPSCSDYISSHFPFPSSSVLEDSSPFLKLVKDTPIQSSAWVMSNLRDLWPLLPFPSVQASTHVPP